MQINKNINIFNLRLFEKSIQINLQKINWKTMQLYWLQSIYDAQGIASPWDGMVSAESEYL